MSEKAIAHVDANFARHIEALKATARIPSISADPGARGALRESAEAVRAAMARAGLENTAVLEVAGAHPYAYGEWLKAPGQPTLLLYAHHDVQPPGRPEHWKTPPFEPT